MEVTPVIWLSVLLFIIVLVSIIAAVLVYDHPPLPSEGVSVHLITREGFVVGGSTEYPSATSTQVATLGGGFPFVFSVVEGTDGYEYVSVIDPTVMFFVPPGSDRVYIGVPTTGSQTQFEYTRGRRIYPSGTTHAWGASNPDLPRQPILLDTGGVSMEDEAFYFHTVRV